MSTLDHFHRYILENSGGCSRLELQVLWRGLQQVYPELASTPSARTKLRELVNLLELDGRLETPKGNNGWDDSSRPALPRWIKIPRPFTSEEKVDPRSVPWAPELRFLATTRVGVPVADLHKLQQFFATDGRQRPSVPIKERSLHIFGDEKRLDDLRRSSTLFGDGRLSLETLRCFVAAEPLAWQRGPTPRGPVLVIENAATWNSYCRWNRERARFSAVVYGCGNRFIEGVANLAEIFREIGGAPRRVLYFGDLDPQGLRIPQQASAYATAAHGLPVVEPELWSYRQLLAIGHGKETVCGGDDALGPDESEWLRELAAPAKAILDAGKRLAQEHVGWEFLSQQRHAEEQLVRQPGTELEK